MGPTLWTSDPYEFEAGWASHYDMLHNSPDGLGIAWEQDNVYSVFDGYHGSLTRYDFASDHGAAGADHGDGIIARYADGEVAGLDDVGAHLAYDSTSGLLYAADTGNSRIVALDTASGAEGDTLSPNYDGAEQYSVDGATLSIVAADVLGDVVLDQPSGLELHDGLLYVSDHGTGFVFALRPDGTVVDFLATGVRDGLGGLAFDPDGHLWIADASADRLIEISPGADQVR